MGSRSVCRMPESEIVARYQAGEPRTLIALRARVPDYHIEAVLTAANVRIRGSAEAIRLVRQIRPWQKKRS